MKWYYWILCLPMLFLFANFSLYDAKSDGITESCNCESLKSGEREFCSTRDENSSTTCRLEADKSCTCSTVHWESDKKTTFVAEIVQQDPCIPIPTDGCHDFKDLYTRLANYFETLSFPEISFKTPLPIAPTIDKKSTTLSLKQKKDFGLVKEKLINDLGFEPSTATLKLLEKDFAKHNQGK